MSKVPTERLTVLGGTRVLDLSTGIAGAYLSKLMADAGADVVKVEPPSGDPWRRRFRGQPTPEDAALFRHLHAGTRSVIGTASEAHVEQLLAGADLVVESGWPAPLDVAALRGRHPHLVVASITPFGRRGPWADRPANDFIAEAESGMLAWHGREDQVPYQSGGRVLDWTAGTMGAAAALAALRRAKATGHGEHIDCSLQATATYSGGGYLDALHIVGGPSDLSRPARAVQAPSIEPTADGWVGFIIQSAEQFDRFLLMIERPDLLGCPEWSRGDLRSARLDEWNEIVHAWTSQRTTAEIVDVAATFRLPVAQVNDGATLFDDEQFRTRGVLVTSADGDFVHPVVPYLIDGCRPESRSAAPQLGEHQGATWSARPRRDPSGPPGRPLEGLRVLDATVFWAGPSAGQALALLGAEVIHLESVQHVDTGRAYVFSQDGDHAWWETGYVWLFNNHNKRDVTLSLTDDRGRDVLRRLVKTCDVVVENFAPRVFEQFGLDHAEMRVVNPSIVFARMPAFGLTGPARDRVGFAPTIEQVTGMCSVTGQRDDPPRATRGPLDPLGGYHTVFAVLVALARRDVTGEGASLEVSLAESGLAAAAELAIERSAYGRVLARDGNRSLDAAPQGLYACAGREQWLALAVTSDAQWDALKAVVGRPAWMDDPALDDDRGRQRSHDVIDVELAAWAADQELAEVVDRLVGAGVPAGAMADTRTMMQHPQLRAFGYYEPVAHPVVGRHEMPTVPFRYGSIDRWTTSPAPSLGRDNEPILTELGYGAEEIAALEAAGIIGTRPMQA